MKKTALGGVKGKSKRAQTLKEVFSFDHFTAQLLVIRISTCLCAGAPGSQPDGRRCWVYLVGCGQKQVRCLRVSRLL